jgi:hypothetical protein
MTIDERTAAEALAETERGEQRSLDLYGYAVAAPYLLVAGLLWLAAGLLHQFSALGAAWAWPATAVVGTPAMAAIAFMQSRSRTRGLRAAGRRASSLDGVFWKGMGVWLMTSAFVVAALTIFAPFSGLEAHAFIGLVSGLAYALAGLWLGRRILVTGVVIAALSLIGYFAVPEHFSLFMALVGGGGMVACALWLRKV